MPHVADKYLFMPLCNVGTCGGMLTRDECVGTCNCMSHPYDVELIGDMRWHVNMVESN